MNTSTALPYYKVMWYNKKNYDDPSNYNLGEAQEVSDYAGKITYAITDYGTLTASDVSIDASTGIVTSNSANEGRIKVTATYLGGARVRLQVSSASSKGAHRYSNPSDT